MGRVSFFFVWSQAVQDRVQRLYMSFIDGLIQGHKENERK